MVEIDPKDVRVSTYPVRRGAWCLSPEAGVEIVHIPSGITVRRHGERSHHANRFAAMEALRNELQSWRPSQQADDVKLLLAQAHNALTRARYLMTLLGGQEHLIDWSAVDKLKADIDGMIDRLEAGERGETKS